MTIERGGVWGVPFGDDREVPCAADDAELATLVEAELRAGRPAEVGVGQGDVARTVGVTGMRSPGERMGFPFDLGYVALDGGAERPFVAHVVVRRRGWRGPGAAVMNAAWFGPWYLGPRAHPNDGLLDVTEGALGWRQRLLARRRLPGGAHLPHPDLTTSRTATWTGRFDPATPVLVDGLAVGRARLVTVRLVADRFTLVA